MDDNKTNDSQGQQDQGSQGTQTNPPVETTHVRPKLPPRDPQILEEGKKISDLEKRNK